MPAKIKKTRISKAATAVEALVAPAAAPTVFELSNMQVEEVSIVDRPANERKFLLRKKKEEEAKKAAEAAKSAGAPADGLIVEDGEGIDLVAAQKAADELKAKDAEAKAKDDAEKAAKAAAPAAAPVPVPAPALAPAVESAVKATVPAVAPAAEIVTDPTAALNELVTATKADITVSTPSGDVTVTVDDTPVAVPPAPQALIDKVKAATLAGIDAIAARLAKFRSDVDTGSISSYNDSGRSEALWGHVYYLKSMLEALYDIGGPSWEIESAVDAAQDVDKSADVNKAHKAINAARVKKFAAVHKCMTYAMKDFSGILKELSQDPEESNDLPADPADVATDRVGKSATPAPVVAPVVVPAPAVISPEILSQITELNKSVNSLKTLVATQAAEIAKARNTLNGSNVQPEDELLATTVPGCDTVIWPADIAAKPSMKRPRF